MDIPGLLAQIHDAALPPAYAHVVFELLKVDVQSRAKVVDHVEDQSRMRSEDLELAQLEGGERSRW